MGRFFNLENPIWRFIGNLADFFFLSLCWYLCCIPVVTLGCGTSALYYVTMKMAANREGYTLRSFWSAFKTDFRTAAPVWLLFLAAALVLYADFTWSLHGSSLFARSMFITFAVVLLLYVLCLSLIFPLIARCEHTVPALLKICFAMSIRNFLPILSTVIVTVAFFAFGLFVFWPVLLIAPGLSAYINSFIYNRIFAGYGLNLPE